MLAGSLLIPLLTGLWSACPVQQGMIHTLVSSYTPGEQMSLEVTPDGTRGFLALGATIAVLDLTQTPPVEIDKHPMPDCQPLAMRYYQDSSGARFLLIAGGALGVWRVTLCPSLFTTPPGPCTAGYADLLIQDQTGIEFGYFQRKRCVDVEILASANPPVLFALFASGSDKPVASQVTELRAYNLSSPIPALMATCYFDTAQSPVQLGTALAADPADNNSVYVAMGKGGIWRADLGGSAGSWTLSRTQVWSTANCSGTYSTQHVRDIAIVRVPFVSKSVLYGALNYNELLEITDIGGTPSCSRIVPSTPGYPERIAAYTNGTSDVRVAVLTQAVNGKWEDDAAPNNNNAAWVGICLEWLNDPDAPPGVLSSQVQFYKHDFNPSGGSPLAPLPQGFINYPSTSMGWNSAALQSGTGGGNRLFVSSRLVGMEIIDIAATAGPPTPVGQPFMGEAFSVEDNVASYSNPGVLVCGTEYVGAVTPPAQMGYIDPLPPYRIRTVPKTTNSPCENAYPLTPYCWPVHPPPPTAPPRGPIEPALYLGHLEDLAHWVDPAAPEYEYFFRGEKIWERYDGLVQGCPVIADCDGNYITPCDSSGNPTWGLERPVDAAGHDMTHMGWRLVRLRLPTGSAMPVDGPSLVAKRWVIDEPHTGVVGLQPAEVEADTDDRTQSIADPRMKNGLPTVVYATRSGSSHGVTAFRTFEIMGLSQSTCGAAKAGTGEHLYPASQSVMTHLEMEYFGTSGTVESSCRQVAHCQASYRGERRTLVNDHTDLYMTRDLSGAPLWVLAIASGYVAAADDPSDPNDQKPGCRWTPYAGLPMLVLVDVTRTGDGVTFATPSVLRVALGNAHGGPGNAFAVRTRSVGNKTYAYVGDITGKILVFDVTGSQLLPPPPHPYVGLGPPPLFLRPVFELGLPMDPCDGLQANCIDIEIVGNYLYCALSRHGVGIVDLTHPTAPALIDVMDTPGLVLGLSTRTVATSHGPDTQLIVGDSHCGVRVYQ